MLFDFLSVLNVALESLLVQKLVFIERVSSSLASLLLERHEFVLSVLFLHLLNLGVPLGIRFVPSLFQNHLGTLLQSDVEGIFAGALHFLCSLLLFLDQALCLDNFTAGILH